MAAAVWKKKNRNNGSFECLKLSIILFIFDICSFFTKRSVETFVFSFCPFKKISYNDMHMLCKSAATTAGDP